MKTSILTTAYILSLLSGSVAAAVENGSREDAARDARRALEGTRAVILEELRANLEVPFPPRRGDDRFGIDDVGGDQPPRGYRGTGDAAFFSNR